MQWRKLFDLNPQFAILSDKLAVRAFIASRVGGEHLVPLLWSGAAEGIPWERLEPPFVLKSTHASGDVIMVDTNADIPLRREELQETAAGWLTRTYGVKDGELGYSEVPRRVLIEKTVTTPTGERPTEVRFFMFDGKIAVINTVFVESGQIRNGSFRREDWTPLDWRFTRVVDRDFPAPKRLRDMIGIAERAAAGLDHVRVDFYDCGDEFWIGEMTLYSWSGYARFAPDEADFLLGSAWRLGRPLRRAVANVLLRERRIRPPDAAIE